MKFALLITLMVLVSACGENIQSYDSLTEEEQRAIRERASAECLVDSEKNFTSFAKSSNAEMAKFKQEYFWKITLPGTTNPDYIYVWKVSGTTVYFLYQQKLGSTTYHKFIKMTPAFNAEMVQNLRVQKCASKFPEITNSSSTINLKYLDVLSNEGTSKYRTDTTYTGSAGQPMFFSIFSQKIFKEKFKKDSDDIESSENLTETIKYEGDDVDFLPAYTDYTNREYCVFKYTTSTAKEFVYPFDLNCVDGATTNANPGTDNTMDFTAAELAR